MKNLILTISLLFLGSWAIAQNSAVNQEKPKELESGQGETRPDTTITGTMSGSSHGQSQTSVSIEDSLKGHQSSDTLMVNPPLRKEDN